MSLLAKKTPLLLRSTSIVIVGFSQASHLFSPRFIYPHTCQMIFLLSKFSIVVECTSNDNSKSQANSKFILGIKNVIFFISKT